MLDRIRYSDNILRPPYPGEIIPNQFSCIEFDLPDTSLMTEEEQLSYLAEIMIDWYFNEYERK